MKKLSILFICAFIALSPLVNCYNFSFAEEEDPKVTWHTCDSPNEVVGAWKAYLTSRNVSLSGSPISALVSYSYEDIKQDLADEGIDIQNLQAGLWYTLQNTEGVVGKYLRFRYSTSAISIFNSIYAKYALQNGLGTNENDTFNKIVKNGLYFVDANNNAAWVYVTDNNDISRSIDNIYLSVQGTEYIADFQEIFKQNLENPNYDETFTMKFSNDLTRTFRIKTDLLNANNHYLKYGFNGTSPSDNAIWYLRYNNEWIYGTVMKNIILTNSTKTQIFYGLLIYRYNFSDGSLNSISWSNYLNLISAPAVDASISAASNGLKNGIKEMANGAVVDLAKKGLNEGYDSIQEFLQDDEPEADPSPTDENGNIINNNIFNLGGIINANGQVNFELPDLNNIKPKAKPLPAHFLISGLKNKFPFCIPFDLIAIYEFLDTEPHAPSIEEEIDFGAFNYELDINLESYDDAMVDIRKFFLILYIFGLLFVTPQLLK